MEIRLDEKSLTENREHLFERLKKEIKDRNADEFVVNLKIGTALIESKEFNQTREVNNFYHISKKYKIGEFMNINCLIDPDMRWNEHTIHFYSTTKGKSKIEVVGKTDVLI